MFFSEVHKQSLGQWSPNGKYLAAAAQNRILIRNAESLKLVQVYVCLDKVERVEWSPDSEFLLTELGRQGIVQVWSLKESEWTCRIDEGLGGVAHARWGLTSKHVLISSDFQLYLSVWALEDQSIAVQIRHPKFANSGLAFSHNGRWLAMLRRCDCQDRLSLYSCEENFARLADVPLAGDFADLVWAPDDAAIMIWERPGRTSRCVWYSLSGDLLAEISDRGLLRSASPSPSSQLLAACGLDGRVQLLSVSGRCALAWLPHDQAAFAEVGDDEVSLLEEYQTPGDGGTGINLAEVSYVQVKVPSTSLLEERNPDLGIDADGLPRQGISLAVWSPDERYLATHHESFPGIVWVWDLGRLALKALLKHRAPVRSFAWDPSPLARGGGSRLAVSTADPALFLWSPTKALAGPCPLSLAKLRWRSDGRSLLIQERDRACTCDLGPPASLNGPPTAELETAASVRPPA
ncbi:unnamed protein product [Polarella glacialis]|uniref:WD repeat-containing protein WRAP73 n=1 Tax=Polarella glacialis TaxID=89957 RepID=A0A813GQ94_POLGL|nr:unnamed protein product [Polarella glacialis]